MPRPLRIEFENAWYHVMNRGANRKVIFKTIAHRKLFYTTIEEVIDRFKIEIHAFCLMNNHYHLLIKTPYPNLGRAMRHLDGIYTQRFNRSTQQDGPLFRGRYKAILIDSDHYLLQVGRYIHLNPIEAKLCIDPLEYKWSSYRLYVKPNQSIRWLTTSTMLNQMHTKDKMAAYETFVKQEIDHETKKFYDKKRLSSIFGKKEFIKKYLNQLDEVYASNVKSDINHTKPIPEVNDILETVTNFFQISPNKLLESTRGKQNTPRIISIYLLSNLCQLTHNAISKIFPCLKEASLPNLLVRFKKQLRANTRIFKIVAQISDQIEQLNHHKFK